MSHHGKLIACIGYSLRLAQKSGQTTTIDHLWHGLYSLTRQDEPVKQPLCLYTALGLDQDVVMNQHPTSSSCAQSATLALGGDLIPLQHCPHIHLSAAPARPTAQGCCNVATQTEVGMISMPDFEAFLARFTKDVEKRLFDNLKHLCAPCPAEPTSPTSSTTVSQAPLADAGIMVDQQSECPSSFARLVAVRGSDEKRQHPEPHQQKADKLAGVG
eukprot:Skav205387  [mRNA]  locus=scaffold1642:27116:27760:+ [translate_table: standard]